MSDCDSEISLRDTSSAQDSRVSHLLSLPPELRQSIWELCSGHDLRRLSRTSRLLESECLREGYRDVDDFTLFQFLDDTGQPRTDPRACAIHNSVERVTEGRGTRLPPTYNYEPSDQAAWLNDAWVSHFRGLKARCPQLQSYQLLSGHLSDMTLLGSDGNARIEALNPDSAGTQLVFKHRHGEPFVTGKEPDQSIHDGVTHSVRFGSGNALEWLQLDDPEESGLNAARHLGYPHHSFDLGASYMTRSAHTYPSHLNSKVLAGQMDLVKSLQPDLSRIDDIAMPSGNYSQHLKVLTKAGMSPQCSIFLKRLARGHRRSEGVPNLADLCVDNDLRESLRDCPAKHILFEVSDAVIPEDFSCKSLSRSKTTKTITLVLSSQPEWDTSPVSRLDDKLMKLDPYNDYRLACPEDTWQRSALESPWPGLDPPYIYTNEPYALENICSHLPEPTDEVERLIYPTSGSSST